MSPSNPIFLWTFLSLIPLAAIYFLKVRPRRKPATAYFLWERIFQEKRATSLLRRLRDFWSLLLMALAFSAVVLALTNPQWASDQRRDMLILIDHSASMSANDGGDTRLQQAKARAAEIVRALNGAQRAAVASVGGELVYRAHLTDNPRTLFDAIDSVQPSDQPFRAAALASQSYDELAGDYRVILLSDGCFDRETLPSPLELMKIGTSRENIGIVSADLRALPDGPRRLGLYCQVASTNEGLINCDLLISHIDDENKETLFKLVPLSVAPGVNPAEVIVLDDAPPGRWVVRLDLEDALAKDNVAYLFAHPPRPVAVGVESEERYFMENSVLAFSRSDGLLALATANPRVVLAKSTTPDAEHALIFQPAGDSPWWSDLGESIDHAVPRVLIEDHPALRFVDVASLPMIGARQLVPIAGAQVLVTSDDGVPLIYYARREGRSAIVVNMDPVAAEFYFSAWFPVLVHSSVTFLAGREAELLPTYRPGDVVTIPGIAAGDATGVTTPLGTNQEVTAKQLPPLDLLGYYELTNKSADWTVACSLLSERETLLDNAAVADTSKPISRGRAPAQLLTMIAVLVITAEGLLYHRRKVG